MRERPTGLNKVIERVKNIQFDRTPTEISQESSYKERLPLLRELYTNTAHWHGTGRYKFSEEGELVDILKGILENDGLNTHQDEWDRKKGITNSISIAPSRMYARLYAGRFCPAATRLKNELGTRELWGSYFFGTSAARGLVEYPRGIGKALIGRYRDAEVVPDFEQKSKTWGSRVTTLDHSLSEVFLYGSDIAENYPILIGIKKEADIQRTEASKFIELHEVRTEQRITLDDISHLEVPREHEKEVQEFIHAHGQDIPVVPIEYGEEYSRNFTFRELTSGKPLER